MYCMLALSLFVSRPNIGLWECFCSMHAVGLVSRSVLVVLSDKTYKLWAGWVTGWLLDCFGLVVICLVSCVDGVRWVCGSVSCVTRRAVRTPWWMIEGRDDANGNGMHVYGCLHFHVCVCAWWQGHMVNRDCIHCDVHLSLFMTQKNFHRLRGTCCRTCKHCTFVWIGAVFYNNSHAALFVFVSFAFAQIRMKVNQIVVGVIVVLCFNCRIKLCKMLKSVLQNWCQTVKTGPPFCRTSLAFIVYVYFGLLIFN